MTESRRRFRSAIAALAIAVLITPAVLVATASGAQAVEQTCEGVPSTIVGTDGNDNLVGTDGPDVISAGQGADFVLGLGGNDVICGGQGDDTIYAGTGGDFTNGGGGFDSCYEHEASRNCE
jgi:Ca2+-binding RTX toxin-like protein